MASRRVLHVLSQRPSLTGSGVTLEAMVRGAAAGGWEQMAVVGVPAESPMPAVGELPADRIRPVRFGAPGAELPFPVPGMSDVMPYRSTVFSEMTPAMLEAYRAAWDRHLAAVVSEFEPRVIHVHHAWLVGASLERVAPGVPVIGHGHGTGLRQMARCPHLAAEVREGARRHAAWVVLHRAQAREYEKALALEPARIEVVGAGYREEVFPGGPPEPPARPTVVFAGKYARAKGLPWLLDAFERLAATRPDLALEVAGTGTGAEAEGLRARMEGLPGVVLHGQIDQATLAALFRRAQVFALPSLFEGLPLVLVEALACGCWPVCTDLPGVAELAEQLGDAVVRIPPPRCRNVDVPEAEDLPAFVDAVAAGLDAALGRYAERGPAAVDLSELTWAAVYARVEAVWNRVIAEWESGERKL